VKEKKKNLTQEQVQKKKKKKQKKKKKKNTEVARPESHPIRGPKRPVSTQKGIKHITANENFTKRITGTQTSFCTNFGGRMRFRPVFPFS